MSDDEPKRITPAKRAELIAAYRDLRQQARTLYTEKQRARVAIAAHHCPTCDALEAAAEAAYERWEDASRRAGDVRTQLVDAINDESEAHRKALFAELHKALGEDGPPMPF